MSSGRGIFSLFKFQNFLFIFLILACYHTFIHTLSLLNKILLKDEEDGSTFRKIIYSLIFNLVCSCIFLFDLIIHIISLYNNKELKTKFIFYLNGPILFIISITFFSFYYIVLLKIEMLTLDENLKTLVISLVISLSSIFLWHAKVLNNMFREFDESYRFIKFETALDLIFSKTN
jgi:hypothetical protein